MDLTSENFDSLSELVWEKDQVSRKHSERILREEIVHGFYNGKPIMSEADADEEGIADITNHLIGYSSLQVLETRVYNIFAGSNKIIDVDVLDGDDAVKIEKDAQYINKFLNQAIYHTSRYGAYWRGVAGELMISGRAACINPETGDWCPRVEPMMFLPDTTGTDSSEIPYAFVPKEMSVSALKGLLREAESDSDDEEMDDIIDEIAESPVFNTDAIESYIKEIRKQIKNSGKATSNKDIRRPRRKQVATDEQQDNNKTTIDVWYYYEVRYDEEAESKVVDLTIFTEQIKDKDDGDKDGSSTTATILAHYPKRYKSASDFCNLIVLDASIGGEKRFATAKGIAEISYNNDVDAEELLNRLIEGAKVRAVPRFQRTDGVNTEELLGWDMALDSEVPKGVAEFNLSNNGADLAGPLQLVRQNSSANAGASFSNSGRNGELRQQAVERQGNNQQVASSRLADVYKSLDIQLRELVLRFFVGEIEPGTPGFEDIMWFRAMMKKHDVDLKFLAKQTYGYFDNISVKAVRSSSSGENDFDLQVAQQLMANIANYPAAVRPLIVNKFTSLLTGDPAFADRLVELLPKVASVQQDNAELEFEQIARDVLIGIETPISSEDVHQEHAVVHLKHLQVIIARGNARPWTREDAAHFAGIQAHAQLHLNELLVNRSTQAEGQTLSEQFANLVAQADGLLAQVQRDEEQAANGQQDIDNELKLREMDLKEREQGRKEADTESTIAQRDKRQSSIDRKGDQDFALNKAKFDAEQSNNQ